MQPLDRLAATATRVSELPLDRGEVALSERVPEADTDPNTEVGKVGSALNRMLQHVANALTARQASENRVRQFVADASHELRTPLAAIRGYAELTRRSGEQVPPDVAFAMSRVESESRRMTTLVEDLLLLARLDSGRPVVQEWVDLCRLVADAVADAHVAGPDHKWLMDVPGEPIGVARRRGPAAPGGDQRAGQRPHAHPGGHHGDDHTVHFGRIGPAARGRRRPGHPAGRPPGRLRALRPRRQLAFAGGGEHRASAWRSWRRWSARTAAGSGCRAGRGGRSSRSPSGGGRLGRRRQCTR